MVGNGKESIPYFVLPLERFPDKHYCLDLYNKSRVKGDLQARFCERLRVKFPLPTRCRDVRFNFKNQTQKRFSHLPSFMKRFNAKNRKITLLFPIKLKKPKKSNLTRLLFSLVTVKVTFRYYQKNLIGDTIFDTPGK